MLVMGIDPGVSGGIAVRGNSLPNGLLVFKMPETPADIVELIRDLCEKYEINHCYLERAQAMRSRDGRKQGVSSAFNYGTSFGALIGILAAWGAPYTLIRPVDWQRALKCLSGGDKRVTKRRAQELFPKTKLTHATADAALIAEYGWREQGTFRVQAEEAAELIQVKH